MSGGRPEAFDDGRVFLLKDAEEQDRSPGDGPVCREELEIDNFEYEFNEIVVNKLGDLDPQYVIDMETIKELLIEQQQNLTGKPGWLLQAKRDRHPEAYEGYREALDSDREG